ncbi:Sucrase/ferredoxin-like-domain-containing protein [Dichotomocladium elegans]|nr:Sucrase/ferredoxin-like-domain-containing protein [Dichotomocladium elegans]
MLRILTSRSLGDISLLVHRTLWVRSVHTKVPFDTMPFPYKRFEPCCPDASKSYENGFVPCTKHPIPRVIGKKIDIHDPLKQFSPSRQLLVCAGPEAPEWSRAKVEGVKEGLVHAMNDVSRHVRCETGLDGPRLLTTICERPSLSASTQWPTCDVIMLPEFRLYPAVNPKDFGAFGKVLEELWRDPLTSLESQDVPYKSMDDVDTLVLVCIHTMRDKRCGVLGPLIVDEFRTALAEQHLLRGSGGRVEVWGVSHYGGNHRIATAYHGLGERERLAEVAILPPLFLD